MTSHATHINKKLTTLAGHFVRWFCMDTLIFFERLMKMHTSGRHVCYHGNLNWLGIRPQIKIESMANIKTHLWQLLYLLPESIEGFPVMHIPSAIFKKHTKTFLLLLLARLPVRTSASVEFCHVNNTLHSSSYSWMEPFFPPAFLSLSSSQSA